MRKYSEGEEYEFIVNYYYTDFDDLGRERSWLSLSDGESEKKYNVPAYPYQENGYEGKTIVCEVIRLLDNGYPYLRQNRAEVLAHCYNEGETYWFSVIDKHTDQNTQSLYYELIDRLNDIKHRYYCSRKEEISGLVAFVVKKVKDYHLEIERVVTNSGNKLDQDKDKLYNPFGHEDDYHEWKASLVFSSSGTDPDNPDVDQQVKNIMRSIAGFQNTEGGLLYIGVTDSGEVCGIESDYCHLNEGCDSNKCYHKNTDGYEQKIRNAVNYYLGKMSLENICFNFYRQLATKRVFCVIKINKTPRPVYCEGKDVFKRFGNGFRTLKGDDITDLVIAKHDDASEQKEFPLTMPNDCEELNPNVNIEPSCPENVASGVVRITPESLNKIDYYYMTFYKDDTFMYSKDSHASENDVLAEVRFNKKRGNPEYSRDILIKFTKDGYAQFLQAYDMCKLGNADTRISLQTKNSLNILTVKVARKYDFIKVLFNNDNEEREKYLRVTSLWGQDTEKDLRANKQADKVKYEFRLKGNRVIPSEFTLKDAFIVHETLPDEIQFVSAKSGSLGKGCIVGSQIEDVASY